MFGDEFSIDPKLSAAIERRRAAEEQRRRRILDDKTRLIGIDVQGLNEQIKERSMIENMEKRRQKELEEEMLCRDRLAVEADNKTKQQRRRLDQDVDHFRRVCQCPQTQRDFDLNDPDGLKKSRPPRVEDLASGDEYCGPASLQKFDGEDLRKNERDRKLREMQHAWLKHQMQERAEFERRAREENERLKAQAKDFDEMAKAKSLSQEEHRRRVSTAIQSYNLQLMEQQRAQKRLSRRLDMERDIIDLENHIFSDILAEDPSVARTSLLGPNRIVTDRWKGMTTDELDKILRSQREQVIEKQSIESNRKRDDEDWERRILGAAHADIIEERHRQRQCKERDRQIAEENRRLAEEQRSMQRHLNKQVYRCGLNSDNFFDRFGKSCR